MSIDEKIRLIREVGEEIITEDELRELLETKKRPVAYDGFEPSGNVHIAQGILRTINVNKMLKAGVKFKMLSADWHAWANNKLGGDLDKIQTTGDYLIEVWKACGMDVKKVDFLRSSDLMSKDSYWKTVMMIAREATLKRAVRCSQIMGRSECETLQASQILYPCMQAADIFEIEADMTQLGMDQRKVNMLAREIGPKLGFAKPVVVSHHMLMGLGQPPASGLKGADRGIEMKMSKSKPDTAIFMTDTKEEIERKIRKAYCPEGNAAENPILEYCRYMIFEKVKRLKIERPAKFGGDMEFGSYIELEKVFAAKKLHPMDLKAAVSRELDKMVKPVREHFEKNKKAKALFETVNGFEITR